MEPFQGSPGLRKLPTQGDAVLALGYDMQPLRGKGSETGLDLCRTMRALPWANEFELYRLQEEQRVPERFGPSKARRQC